MKKVFLQYAMRLEAEPLLKELSARRVFVNWSENFPFEIYEAEIQGLKVFIGVAGQDPRHEFDSIGSVPAAVLAQLAISHLKPELVINPGTCGGFQSQNHQIADVLIGTKYVAFHHRRSSIPAMREYGFGKYPVCDSTALRAALAIPDGIVSSGDALDYSKEDEEYIAANGGTLKEMEAAAIGWVCSFARLPLLPVKSITDWVDHPADTGKQFLANYSHAVQNLTHELMRILNYLATHQSDAVWRP